MNSEQFTKYLNLIDYPSQLTPAPDVGSLFLLYRGHITRFPYQNVDLYKGAPEPSLDVAQNIDYM